MQAPSGKHHLSASVSLQPILSNTYGCIVYQEQVIEIFRKLAGYSLGRGGHGSPGHFQKKAAQIQREKRRFCTAMRNAVSAAVSTMGSQNKQPRIFISRFMILPTTPLTRRMRSMRWWPIKRLTCHYTKEYMAALLTSVLDNSDKIAEYINECRDCGIRLLPPDINYSDDTFTVEDGGIRFGLVAIKNMGAALSVR